MLPNLNFCDIFQYKMSSEFSYMINDKQGEAWKAFFSDALQ
jgi:hypothetical protein